MGDDVPTNNVEVKERRFPARGVTMTGLCFDRVKCYNHVYFPAFELDMKNDEKSVSPAFL